MKAKPHLVVVAASAGGLKALSEILSHLPQSFPVPILVVQHLNPLRPSLMVPILSKRTPLRIKQAQPGDLLDSGTVYIAPPDQHLLVNPDGTLGLSHEAKVCYSRPAADVLFKSVAANFLHQVIAVVLTGMNNDGAAGIQAIKKMGGVVIAQDQASSDFFTMPLATITTGDVDYILPLVAIAPILLKLVSQ